MTTVLAQAIDQRLYGATAAARAGAAGGGGTVFAFISPWTKTLVIIDFSVAGKPRVVGGLSLPLPVEAITVDTATGLTLYITGLEVMYAVTLNAGTFVPTLAATYPLKTIGHGGISFTDPTGNYLGVSGPFFRPSALSASSSTYLYVYDPDTLTLYTYLTSASQPYLTLLGMLAAPGATAPKALRVGVTASGTQLYLVTDLDVITFSLTDPTAPVKTSQVRAGPGLRDIIAARDTVHSSYIMHLAARPQIDGQAGAPIAIEPADLVVDLPNAGGVLVIALNKYQGKVTVWQ